MGVRVYPVINVGVSIQRWNTSFIPQLKQPSDRWIGSKKVKVSRIFAGARRGLHLTLLQYIAKTWVLNIRWILQPHYQPLNSSNLKFRTSHFMHLIHRSITCRKVSAGKVIGTICSLKLNFAQQSWQSTSDKMGASSSVTKEEVEKLPQYAILGGDAKFKGDEYG